MKVTVIANAKGGVGKSSTAVTLATGLAGMGHNTLLVDLDAQPGSGPSSGGSARSPSAPPYWAWPKTVLRCWPVCPHPTWAGCWSLAGRGRCPAT